MTPASASTPHLTDHTLAEAFLMADGVYAERVIIYDSGRDDDDVDVDDSTPDHRVQPGSCSVLKLI